MQQLPQWFHISRGMKIAQEKVLRSGGLFPEIRRAHAVRPAESRIRIHPGFLADDGFSTRFAQTLCTGHEADQIIPVEHHLQADEMGHHGACVHHAALPEDGFHFLCVVCDIIGAKRRLPMLEGQDRVGSRARHAVVHAADSADGVDGHIAAVNMGGIVSVTADDVRGMIECHLPEEGQRAFRIEDGKAVVIRHGVAECDVFQLQHFGKCDLLRGKQGSIVAREREVRAGIAWIACHRGEYIALVIAVQAGDAFCLEQGKRLARTGTEIDLIAQ